MDAANTDKPTSQTAGATGPAEPAGSEPKAPTFTAEQQAEINRLLGVARSEGRDAERTRAQEAADADKARTEREEAAKRGEHEKVISGLEQKLAGAEDQLKAATDELKAWRDLAAGELEAGITSLKKKNPKIAALDPGGDDLFVRRSWLAKAIDAAEDTAPAEGNGANPPNTGPAAVKVDDIYKQLAAARGVRV
ncbi:MAG: hypothetical protein JSR79_05035 [Proteobacteria bacterium]|nr:hypothetical protein [Pseudomonadota bacterium]